MKVIKLGLAAILTAGLCFTGLYFYDYDKFYWLYRCFRYAPSGASCSNPTDHDFTVDFYGMKYMGNTQNLIDRSILFVGAYEKPILYFMRDVMNSIYGGNGAFVDVGANTGQHSIFMSRYAKEIHAFEPYEPVLLKFRNMIAINELKNITVHPVGLGSENVKKRFYKPHETNIGTGSFVEGFKNENTPYDELEIQKGDDALRKAGVSRVALIKIDIEGFEKPALLGLGQTLSAHRPVVVFEITLGLNHPDAFTSREDLSAAFPRDYDFLVFRKPHALAMGTYHLTELGRDLRFDVASQYDFVAFPKEKSRQLPRSNSK